MKQQTATVPAASPAPTPNGSAPASTNGASKLHAGNIACLAEPVVQLPLDRCIVAEFNTRKPEPKDVRELALSLKSTGQTTPAIARPHPKKKDCFEIGAGSRRLVACREAGIPTLAAIVRSYDDASFEELILVENMQREDADPKAEVELLDRLVKRGVSSAEQISEHLGKPKHWAERRLRLLKVIEPLRKLWAKQDSDIYHFSADMMSLLGSLPQETQQSFIKRPDSYSWAPIRDFTRLGSRADLQKYLDRNTLCSLENPPFDLNDPFTFVKGCGPGCACDSSHMAALFGDGKEPAKCLNPTCFKQRLQLANKAKLDAIKKEHGDLPIVYNGGEGVTGNDELLMFGKIGAAHSYRSYDGESVTSTEPKGDAAKQAKKVLLWKPSSSSLNVAWLTKKKVAGSSSSLSRVKSSAESLKQRKQTLQGKRLMLVHEELVKALRASKRNDCGEDVIDLATIFGLPYREDDHTKAPWQMFDARKAKGYTVQPNSGRLYTVGAKAETFKTREEALWHGLKYLLEEKMQPSTRMMDVSAAEYDMRRVAKLISFDFDGAKKQADEKIKPPKTWGAVDIHTLEPVKVTKQLNPKTQCEQALDAKQQRGEAPDNIASEAAVWLDNEKRGATKLTPQARARCRAILAALPSARRAQIIQTAKTPAKKAAKKVGGASAPRPTPPSSRRKEGPRKPSPAKPQKTAAKKSSRK